MLETLSRAPNAHAFPEAFELVTVELTNIPTDEWTARDISFAISALERAKVRPDELIAFWEQKLISSGKLKFSDGELVNILKAVLTLELQGGEISTAVGAQISSNIDGMSLKNAALVFVLSSKLQDWELLEATAISITGKVTAERLTVHDAANLATAGLWMTKLGPTACQVILGKLVDTSPIGLAARLEIAEKLAMCSRDFIDQFPVRTVVSGILKSPEELTVSQCLSLAKYAFSCGCDNFEIATFLNSRKFVFRDALLTSAQASDLASLAARVGLDDYWFRLTARLSSGNESF
jgi:hypothetical protein